MTLASIEGQLVVVAIMAVVGLINWVSSKLNAGGKAPPPSGTPHDAGPRRAPADSEEERMRRFLEALGLPADSRPAPPVQRPRPANPPVPPIVAQPPPGLPVRPRAKKRPAPPPLPESPRRVSLDEAPAPTLPVEQLSLAELSTPALPEFDTRSSKITAIPGDVTLPQEASSRRGPTLSEALRAALASPQQLRSAFVLREVLGPPIGLSR
jgi:hypothetical protein